MLDFEASSFSDFGNFSLALWLSFSLSLLSCLLSPLSSLLFLSPHSPLASLLSPLSPLLFPLSSLLFPLYPLLCPSLCLLSEAFNNSQPIKLEILKCTCWLSGRT